MKVLVIFIFLQLIFIIINLDDIKFDNKSLLPNHVLLTPSYLKNGSFYEFLFFDSAINSDKLILNSLHD